MKTIEVLKLLKQGIIEQLPQDMLNIMESSLSDMLSKKLDSHAIATWRYCTKFYININRESAG